LTETAWSTACPDLVKTCSCCGIEKLATAEYFSRNAAGKYGLRGQCKECRNAGVRVRLRDPEIAEKRKKYEREYVSSGRAAAAGRKWRAANREKALTTQRKWKAENRDKIRESERLRRERTRDKVREKQRRCDARRRQDPAYVLKKRIKARLRQMLTRVPSKRTEEILGYTKEQFAKHIERQFTHGMSWERLLNGEIHIDHIVPVSSFNIVTADDPDFKACWGLSNLRPMWALENQKKQAKVLTLL